MKVRYPAAVLVASSAISGMAYLWLCFQYQDLDLGWEFDEQTRKMHGVQHIAGWVWCISAALLSGILFYRWFIDPGKG